MLNKINSLSLSVNANSVFLSASGTDEAGESVSVSRSRSLPDRDVAVVHKCAARLVGAVEEAIARVIADEEAAKAAAESTPEEGTDGHATV